MAVNHVLSPQARYDLQMAWVEQRRQNLDQENGEFIHFGMKFSGGVWHYIAHGSVVEGLKCSAFLPSTGNKAKDLCLPITARFPFRRYDVGPAFILAKEWCSKMDFAFEFRHLYTEAAAGANGGVPNYVARTQSMELYRNARLLREHNEIVQKLEEIWALTPADIHIYGMDHAVHMVD